MTDIIEPDRLVLADPRGEHGLDTKIIRLDAGFYVRHGKRAVDIVLSVVLIVLLAPLFAVLSVLIARDGAAPFFVQRRSGLGGDTFGCFKFRTMVPDAESRLAEVLARDPAAAEEWQRMHKLERDPRVTRIGRILRATSLDELPQLFNVLRGEMSLVGPRPVTAEELERYGAMASTVFSIRPGMTGMWQVLGRGRGVSYAERVRLDLSYVRSLSLFQDISIMMKTALVVLRGTGT